ncbi:MAG: DUF4189 domain-containing protein [Planctomycetaceae bacterium]|nr:DUF4189 domain-containing protein [Planctomycetaceae bacterium]
MTRNTLMSLILCNALIGTMIAQGDDYYSQLERRQRDQDRDRENFSWLMESEDNAFAAIAYSPKTGKYGYSYEYDTRSAACQEARRHCQEQDVQIVASVANGYCALAVGTDGHGTGFGSTPAQARSMALRECSKRTTYGKVVVCVFSGN